MPRARESNVGGSTAQAQQEAVSEGIENFELPRSLVMKLARASQVPENTKFQKDVILSILKASTVFINYIAATAHEVAASKQHKSISATDVLKALELVEFGDIAQNIQGELQLYRDTQKAGKKTTGAKPKAKDASDPATAASKAKGKAKAAEPAAEASASAAPAPASGVIPPILIPRPVSSAAPGPPGQPELDADTEMADSEGPPPPAETRHEEEQEGIEDEPEDEPEEDVDEDLDEDDEGEGEGTEPEDMIAVEEEELRKDARGLDGIESGED